MKRLMTISLMILLLGGFYGLYSLSRQVRLIQKQTELLDRQTKAEQQAIRVLQAEWSYLNRPLYLQSLADRVELVQVSPNQFSTWEDIPFAVSVSLDDNTGSDGAPVKQSIDELKVRSLGGVM